MSLNNAPATSARRHGPEIFNNPVIWEDLPDPEVIRVRDVYYMSASSFAFSPGAPVLASRNLIDWDYIGHSVPELAFGERFYLTGQHAGAYVKGVWASSMRYRESNKTFYWYGAIQGTEKTYIYTAKAPGDLWTRLASIDKFYYDLGLLIDDDDSFYMAYGTKTIYVALLSSDGTKELESRVSICRKLFSHSSSVNRGSLRPFTAQRSISKERECTTSQESTTFGSQDQVQANTSSSPRLARSGLTSREG